MELTSCIRYKEQGFHHRGCSSTPHTAPSRFQQVLTGNIPPTPQPIRRVCGAAQWCHSQSGECAVPPMDTPQRRREDTLEEREGEACFEENKGELGKGTQLGTQMAVHHAWGVTSEGTTAHGGLHTVAHHLRDCSPWGTHASTGTPLRNNTRECQQPTPNYRLKKKIKKSNKFYKDSSTQFSLRIHVTIICSLCVIYETVLSRFPCVGIVLWGQNCKTVTRKYFLWFKST